jgi:hypothetical protein
VTPALAPWTRAAKPHPACEVRAGLTSAEVLAHLAGALQAQRYRIEPVDGTSFVARRGHRGLNRFLDTEILDPTFGLLQYTVLDVDGLAPDSAGRGGARLRCPDGYQQIGAAGRVATQIGRAVADLVHRGVPAVTVSPWFSDPAWERPVSDA